MDSYLLSIIVPTLGNLTNLNKLMGSIPECESIEVIIVNGSDALIEKLLDRDVFVINEQDRGQSDAINKGIRASSAKFFTFIGDDDYYNPFAIKDLVNRLSEYKEHDLLHYGLITCDFTLLNNQRNTHNEVSTFGPKGYCDLSIDLPYRIHQVSTFFNTKLVKTHGLYLDETLNYTMDRDLLYRVMAISKPLYIPINLSTFVIHSGSKSGSVFKSFYKEFAKMNYSVGIELFGRKNKLKRILNTLKIHSKGFIKESDYLRINRKKFLSLFNIAKALFIYPVYLAKLYFWKKLLKTLLS